MLTVCLRTKQIINSFQEGHRKENVIMLKLLKLKCYYVKIIKIMFFARIPLCLLHLSTCLTGWVYGQELGLYWLNRVEAPLLNQIRCGSLICAALVVDFICWNCAFALFLDLDSMSAQFFQTRLQITIIVLYSNNYVFL